MKLGGSLLVSSIAITNYKNEENKRGPVSGPHSFLFFDGCDFYTRNDREPVYHGFNFKC